MSDLVEVRIDAKYGESIEGGILYNYQGGFGMSIKVEPGEEKEWKEKNGKKFKATFNWLRNIIKESIKEAQEKDGVKTDG